MSFKALIKPFYRKIFKDHVYFLKRELQGCNSVLDLGCGADSSLQYCKVPFSLGVELFGPYIEESKQKKIHTQYLKEDITKVVFSDKSFDAVILIDVLEHLEKEEGLALIQKAERWAKKKIVVFTPNGFVKQDDFDRNPLQGHQSGWSVGELEQLGFKAFGLNGFKKLRGERAAFRYRPYFLTRLVSEASQTVVYYYPKLAFHIFAVKKITSL